MPNLALNIVMKGMRVLVAGCGNVAGRKISTLLDAGADVHVVSPEVTPDIELLAESGRISLKKDRYGADDLDGVFLAVAATNDPGVNRCIADDAFSRGILVAVADESGSGTCFFPAILRRGDLEMTVSTSGRCPAFAAEIRDLVAEVISEEFGEMLEHLSSEREKLLTEGNPSTYNRTILRSRARELIDEFMDHKERVP